MSTTTPRRRSRRIATFDQGRVASVTYVPRVRPPKPVPAWGGKAAQITPTRAPAKPKQLPEIRQSKQLAQMSQLKSAPAAPRFSVGGFPPPDLRARSTAGFSAVKKPAPVPARATVKKVTVDAPEPPPATDRNGQLKRLCQMTQFSASLAAGASDVHGR
jgi:hypothetical protein